MEAAKVDLFIIYIEQTVDSLVHIRVLWSQKAASKYRLGLSTRQNIHFKWVGFKHILTIHNINIRWDSLVHRGMLWPQETASKYRLGLSKR